MIDKTKQQDLKRTPSEEGVLRYGRTQCICDIFPGFGRRLVTIQSISCCLYTPSSSWSLNSLSPILRVMKLEYINEGFRGSQSLCGSRQSLVLEMLLMGLMQQLWCREQHLFLSSLAYVTYNSIIKMMTRITYGICPLVYIKPDYIIIFFCNIRSYYIYLLILSKLRSRRKDRLRWAILICL